MIPKRWAARAVDRSRLRRLVREAFRHEQAKWSGYDCVFRLKSAYPAGVDLAQSARSLLAPGPRT